MTTAPAADSPSTPQLNDCWNSIGVRGDSSCVELNVQVHCRNCPVFAAAAGELLGADLPEGYLAEWTRHFAQPAAAAGQHAESALIFRLGDEWLALRTEVFEEVADQRPIHSLPGRRAGAVLGLVNVRGELLPCLSLARLLGINAATAAPSEKRHAAPARLMVLRRQGARTVFPADEVHGISRYDTAELKETPLTVAHATQRYTQAVLPWRGHSVGLLDDELLFHAFNRSLSSAAPI